jgi:hypothetical protein
MPIHHLDIQLCKKENGKNSLPYDNEKETLRF